MCVSCILAAVTIQGQRLFHSELPIVRLLFESDDYLKKYVICHKHELATYGERMVRIVATEL